MFSQKPISRFKKSRILLITFVLVVLVFSALIAIAINKSMDVMIQNSGRITLIGLDAYGGDINSANGVFSIDWGKWYLGSSKNVSFYLRSISNVPITLAFSLSGWQPEDIEPFIHVSWNYTGKQIAPNEEIPIRIDLRAVNMVGLVDYLIANYVTSFSFSLSIYAVES